MNENYIYFLIAVIVACTVFGVMAWLADGIERRSLKKQQEFDRELEDFWRDK